MAGGRPWLVGGSDGGEWIGRCWVGGYREAELTEALGAELQWPSELPPATRRRLAGQAAGWQGLVAGSEWMAVTVASGQWSVTVVSGGVGCHLERGQFLCRQRPAGGQARPQRGSGWW